MRSYLKSSKLWLYVSGDHPIPEQVDKETDSAYAIRIEDWESANHHIISWFHNTYIPSMLMSLATLILPKKFGTYLLLSMLDRVVLATSSSHTNFIRFVKNQVSGSLYIIAG